MAQGPNINSMVKRAKSTLADANKKFPSSYPTSTSSAPVSKPASTSGPSLPFMGGQAVDTQGLKARESAMHEMLPKMHQGGLVMMDGKYELKAGEKVTPEGRNHKMNQKRVPIESKATGAGTKGVMSKGANKVAGCTDEDHNRPQKAIHLKAKELKHAPSDWKAAKCPGPMCNCSDCQDDRR